MVQGLDPDAEVEVKPPALMGPGRCRPYSRKGILQDGRRFRRKEKVDVGHTCAESLNVKTNQESNAPMRPNTRQKTSFLAGLASFALLTAAPKERRMSGGSVCRASRSDHKTKEMFQVNRSECTHVGQDGFDVGQRLATRSAQGI